MPGQTSQRTVSLKDIAEKAGVSVATVSRVLRDKGEISEEVRDRIKGIAADLNWRKNLLVQGFQTGKSQLIGVLVRPSNHFSMQIISGIHDVLMRNNYAPLLLWATHGQGGFSEEVQLNRALEYRVDGILMIPELMMQGDDYLEKVWQQGIPIVCMDSHMPKTHADYVGHDAETGGRLVAEHLLSRGHRKFAHYAGPSYSISVSGRGKGFEEAVSAAGGTCRTVTDNSFGGALEPAIEFLRELDGETAVFADNDYQAEQLYLAAAKLGIPIPDDISIVGFADIPLGRNLAPALTTVSQDGYELGATAAKHLLSRVSGENQKLETEKILLPVELVERDSVRQL